MKITTLAFAVAGVLSATSVIAAEPTNQELLDLIKKQQQQIEKLSKKVESTDSKVESTVEAVETKLINTSKSKTTIGGYGELHYNNNEEEDVIDLHRFVLFAGHEFTDSIRFYSELEVEHAFIEGGEGGEVAVEQAYIEFDLSDTTQIKTGMYLVPVGLINETHEPPTFYGVERNPVEHDIIPATWREGGVAATYQPKQGLTFNFALSGGLNVPTSGDDAFAVRDGRQGVSKAKTNNFAYTARLKYTAIPGLELAATYHIQDDVTQGDLDVGATLLETHVVYSVGQFSLRALYATWDIDGPEATSFGRDEQTGYYIEPSFKINEKLGLFARYNAWDNNAGNSVDTEKKQTNVGLNYWPDKNVVLKFDFQNNSGAIDGNGFNLGVGYQF